VGSDFVTDRRRAAGFDAIITEPVVETIDGTVTATVTLTVTATVTLTVTATAGARHGRYGLRLRYRLTANRYRPDCAAKTAQPFSVRRYFTPAASSAGLPPSVTRPLSDAGT
jgi:hypothetical protein